MLQEHWLLPYELSMLSRLHPDLLAVGLSKSAVNITNGILIGSPYRGTAILYRKYLGNNVIVVDSSDPRVCAIKLMTNHGPVLFVCVYLPADTGDAECIENYISTCANVTALCENCDALHHVLRGSASTVLTATGLVNGKGQILTPPPAESSPLRRSPKNCHVCCG